MQTEVDKKRAEAHVHLRVGHGEPERKTVPAGPTEVGHLKKELGLPLTDALYLVHGDERRLLPDSNTLNVETGMHFLAERKPLEAHVTLGIDDKPIEKKTIPAGETRVSALKKELGVPESVVLYLVHNHRRRVLDDAETINVESGMHFEAITGGKAS